MKVGDKVYLEDRESEIIAISYDEQGEKIYTVKDSPKDYYEHDFYEFMHSELSAVQNLLDEYKEAYADYQELGKEYSKLEDRLQEYRYAMAMISEICVDESKSHITSRDAVEKIRNHILFFNSEEGDHIPRID